MDECKTKWCGEPLVGGASCKVYAKIRKSSFEKRFRETLFDEKIVGSVPKVSH